MFNVVERNRDEFRFFQQSAACRMALTNGFPVSLSRNLEEHAISHYMAAAACDNEESYLFEWNQGQQGSLQWQQPFVIRHFQFAAKNGMNS